MASIIKKKIKGQIYYYAAESKRVNGKPRIVWQKYLGKVGDIVEAVNSVETLPEPKTAKVYSFGVEAALLGIARRLGVKEIINKYVGQAENGPDPGEFILLHAINNCTDPGAKLADWFSNTVLRRHFITNPRMLTEKKFREISESFTEEVATNVQIELVNRIYAEFGIGTRSLIYHEVKLPTGTIAVRNSKRIMDTPRIGLLVSSDFLVPLFYEIYEKNLMNSARIDDYSVKLIESYNRLGRKERDITVVKHLCSNPEDSYLDLFDVIGVLPGSDNEDLLDVSLDRFHPLKATHKDKVKVYRCSKKLSGQNRTILVIHSEKEIARQMNLVGSSLQQCIQELLELKTCLQIRGEISENEENNLSFVEKRLGEILNKPYIKSMVSVSLSFKENGRVNLNFTVNANTLTQLEEKNLGKSILYMNNANWDNDEIYNAFKGRSELEKTLSAFKKRGSQSTRPFQRDEAAQRLIIFHTILGLTLQTLLRRELYRCGIKGSTQDIFRTLSDIHEVAVFYTQKEQRIKKREYITLSKLNSKQKEVYDYLRLSQFEEAADGGES